MIVRTDEYQVTGDCISMLVLVKKLTSLKKVSQITRAYRFRLLAFEPIKELCFL